MGFNSFVSLKSRFIVLVIFYLTSGKMCLSTVHHCVGFFNLTRFFDYQKKILPALVPYLSHSHEPLQPFHLLIPTLVIFCIFHIVSV